MLSGLEADLARRLGSVRGASVLLDTEKFADLLRLSFPETPLEDLRRQYIRLKPDANLVVSYQARSGRTAVSFYGKAYSMADLGKLEKARQRRAAARAMAAERFFWPNIGLEVCLFPRDNKLRDLPRIWDPSKRRRLLRQILPAETRLLHAPARTLAYKPERRWVGKLERNSSHSGVLKAYSPAGFEAARRSWRGASCGSSAATPKILGESSHGSFIVFEWLPGQPMGVHLGKPEAEAIAARVGNALAKIHDNSSWEPAARSRADEAAHAQAVAEFLAFLIPGEAERIARLSERLTSMVAGWANRCFPVHGDFYAKQVIIDKDSVGILDFDDAHLGDPAEDLGNFAAHLEVDVMLGRLSQEQANSYSVVLSEAHAQAAGHVSVTSLRSYSALKLFELAPRFFRSGETAWPALTSRCLDRVAELLKFSGRGCSVTQRQYTPPNTRASHSRGLESDEKFQRLLPALDASIAGPILAQVTGWSDLHLRGIRLVRHKPGRRALIEYAVARPRSGRELPPENVLLLGKMRARGLDHRALRLLTDLRERDFHDASVDEISVPEPLGAIPEWHMWLQRCVPAPPLTSWLAGPRGPEACQRAAAALCKLHQTPLKQDRTHRLEDELAILRQGLLTLAREQPHLSPRLDELFETCRRAGLTAPPSPFCGIHRDFYPDQLLWDGGRVYLLDLDLYSWGDPHVDAGNFVAHLIEWSWRRLGRPNALQDCECAFIERFLAESQECTAEGVHLYATLALARHVFLSARFPDRRHLTEPLLEFSQARLRCVAAEASS